MRTIQNTTFVGVGGDLVELDKFGDRIESYQVSNYVAGAENGSFLPVSIGVYNRSTQVYVAHKRVLWPGDTTEVPPDQVLAICGREETNGKFRSVGGEYFDTGTGVCRKCAAGYYVEPSEGCDSDLANCVNAELCNSCKRKKDTYQNETGATGAADVFFYFSARLHSSAYAGVRISLQHFPPARSA